MDKSTFSGTICSEILLCVPRCPARGSSQWRAAKACAAQASRREPPPPLARCIDAARDASTIAASRASQSKLRMLDASELGLYGPRVLHVREVPRPHAAPMLPPCGP